MKKQLKNRIQRMKLWQKLLSVYLVISVIPVLILTVFTCSSSIRLMRSQVATRLSTAAAAVGTQVEENLHLIDNVCQPVIYDDSFLLLLQKASSSLSSEQFVRKQLQEIKQQLDPSFHYTTKITLFLANGKVLSADNAVSTDSFEAINADFPKQQYRSFLCDQSQTIIHYRLIDPYRPDTTVGFLSVAEKNEFFFGNQMIQNSDEYIFIVQNQAGKNLYLDSHLKQNFGQVVLNKFKQSTRNTVRIHNKSYLFKPLYIECTDWYLYLLIPQDTLYKGFSPILIGAITIGIICLIAVAFFSVLSSLKISKRINNIASEMVLIGEGQLDLQTDIDPSKDEIGQLSLLFNRMMERINSLIIEQYKNEIRRKEEQLHILQNQINPHFLYNCMDTINWRSIMNNDAQTSAFATNLADFYRTCLNKGNTKIRLHDEFRNVRAYVYLQMDMHNNSFDYEEDIDPVLEEYQGINLMLQPLVENALEHGLEPLPNGQRGKIKITAKLIQTAQEPLVQIDVFNSGVPIDEETAKAVIEGNKGYGFSNVNTRIQLFFGEQYGITIHPDPNGTVCTIIIPAKEWDAE
ncbi:MAG: histidine kinase [Clostridia bacterium]|nr:histidine kinase [Clostridia bacterium]